MVYRIYTKPVTCSENLNVRFAVTGYNSITHFHILNWKLLPAYFLNTVHTEIFENDVNINPRPTKVFFTTYLTKEGHYDPLPGNSLLSTPHS